MKASLEQGHSGLASGIRQNSKFHWKLYQLTLSCIVKRSYFNLCFSRSNLIYFIRVKKVFPIRCVARYCSTEQTTIHHQSWNESLKLDTYTFFNWIYCFYKSAYHCINSDHRYILWGYNPYSSWPYNGKMTQKFRILLVALLKTHFVKCPKLDS